MGKKFWCSNNIKEIQIESYEEIPEGFIPHKRLFRKRPKQSESMMGHKGYWTGKKMPSDSRGITLHKQYESGKAVPWNKGLKNDPRCKGHEPGKVAWNKGKTGLYTMSDDSKQKNYETKKKNNSFNKSKPEENYYNQLCNEFGKDDIIRQYTDVRYGNFICDFYIISKDKFIELHKHWTHGGHAFNPKDNNDLKKLEFWKSKNSKFYNNAIQVWTVRDPMKVKLALENNLNIEFIY